MRGDLVFENLKHKAVLNIKACLVFDTNMFESLMLLFSNRLPTHFRRNIRNFQKKKYRKISENKFFAESASKIQSILPGLEGA